MYYYYGTVIISIYFTGTACCKLWISKFYIRLHT